jgi:hypothetical protein
LWAIAIALSLASSVHAQGFTELNEPNGKIWEAEVAQRNFAAGPQRVSRGLLKLIEIC